MQKSQIFLSTAVAVALTLAYQIGAVSGRDKDEAVNTAYRKGFWEGRTSAMEDLADYTKGMRAAKVHMTAEGWSRFEEAMQGLCRIETPNSN